jgi:hypothetical protein
MAVDIEKGVHCILSKDTQKSLIEPRPLAETSEYLVTFAVDADINKAMDAASWSMIELAYSLASMNAHRALFVRIPQTSGEQACRNALTH